MKIEVSRASQGIRNNVVPPVPRAITEKYTSIDVRCCSRVDELCHQETRENWYKEGSNHRLINNCIARDFIDGSSGWFLEIESVESFIKEVGTCVVRYTQNGWLHFNIYDDYLE